MANLPQPQPLDGRRLPGAAWLVSVGVHVLVLSLLPSPLPPPDSPAINAGVIRVSLSAAPPAAIAAANTGANTATNTGPGHRVGTETAAVRGATSTASLPPERQSSADERARVHPAVAVAVAVVSPPAPADAATPAGPPIVASPPLHSGPATPSPAKPPTTAANRLDRPAPPAKPHPASDHASRRRTAAPIVASGRLATSPASSAHTVTADSERQLPLAADHATATAAVSPHSAVVASGHDIGITTVVAGGPDRPAPRYPSRARRQGLQGRVTLMVQVGADGRAADVRVSLSSGYRLLDRAALKAVRAWTFDARTARRVRVPIVFRLEG